MSLPLHVACLLWKPGTDLSPFPPQNIVDTSRDKLSIRLWVGLAAPPDACEVKGFCILERMNEDRLYLSLCEREGFSRVKRPTRGLGHLFENVAKRLEDGLALRNRS